MSMEYLSIYAFNDTEKNILSQNKDIVDGKIKLSTKDVKIYFYLKEVKGEIGLTELVKKCLTDKGYDVNDKIMYKPRKKAKSDEYYEKGSFWGNDEFRVDTFSRALTKLIKVGLVKKRTTDISNFFQTIVKE